MKKLFAMVLAVVMTVTVFSMNASALNKNTVKLLMSSENVTISNAVWADHYTDEELDAAVENAAEGVIPEECNVRPGRIVVYQQRNISCSDDDVYDATFKVWGTLTRTVCLFFRSDETMEWELLACNLGDVIEARFPGPGSYVIAVAR